MLKTSLYSVSFSTLPAGFQPLRIVQLSDLHGRIWGKGNEILAEAVRLLRPHLIVMTGDMVNAGSGRQTAEGRRAFLLLCRTLAALCPVYYSLGNHELEMPSHYLGIWLSKVSRTGVTVLDNAQTEFFHDGITFPLFGLTTPLLYYKNPLRKPYDPKANWTSRDMGRIFGSGSAPVQEGRGPSILLAHDPLYFAAYQDWGAALTFSGHIHGGIIRLPFIGGLLSPDLTLFPKYDGGLFSENRHGKSGELPQYLVVSRGLASTFLMRIGNPMEIVCTTVISSAKA